MTAADDSSPLKPLQRTDTPTATFTAAPRFDTYLVALHLQWGGAYGHSWFIDRANGLSLVALTNTAFEGMSGAFPADIRNAVYA